MPKRSWISRSNRLAGKEMPASEGISGSVAVDLEHQLDRGDQEDPT